MGEVKRCAACGKENPVSEMKVCMHHQMHRYVCDSKCMTDFYNQPKKPTAAELEAKVATLEAENAKLRTELERRESDGWKLVPVERITIALESVQNAMEDAYNNAYQECCGRGQGQCCGDPVAAWSDADTTIMDALAPAQRELSALLTAAPSAPATVQGGVYSSDPLACSGCVSGCFRCRSDTVRGVNQQLLEALEKVDSEHEILGRMKTCELRRGRGSFGIAVMSDELALDWQSHQKNLERLIDLRHAAIAAARKGEGE